jgi:hypothetical protein
MLRNAQTLTRADSALKTVATFRRHNQRVAKRAVSHTTRQDHRPYRNTPVIAVHHSRKGAKTQGAILLDPPAPAFAGGV